MPIQTAILGFGLSGAVFHAPLLAASDEFEIAAVASSRPERVRAALGDVRVESDAAALAADPSLDLVVVAAPPSEHVRLAEAALRAGNHVVVEKPFTIASAEADRLAALADERGLVLSVFQNRRWDGDYLTARRLAESGRLGDVRTVESHFDRFRPEVRDRWKENDAAAGGVLYDLGSHLVDQVLVWFGPPEAVWADAFAQREESTADDYAHVVLRWGRRRAVLHIGSLVAAPTPRLAVHGTGGSYVTYGLDPQEDALRDGRSPREADWGREDPEAFGTLTSGSGEAETVETVAGDYPAFYAGLARALQTGTPPPVTAREAADVIRVLELARQSSAERREVAWDR